MEIGGVDVRSRREKVFALANTGNEPIETPC